MAREWMGPDLALEEFTGIPKEEILEVAEREFKRMVEEGQIYKLITPYGDLLVIDHPLLRVNRPSAPGSRKQSSR